MREATQSIDRHGDSHHPLVTSQVASNHLISHATPNESGGIHLASDIQAAPQTRSAETPA